MGASRASLALLVACAACRGGAPIAAAHDAGAPLAAVADAADDAVDAADDDADADADAPDAFVVREAGPGPFGAYLGDVTGAAVERRGGSVRVLFARAGVLSIGGITDKPVELVGRTEPSGAFHASAFGTKISLDGSIDAVGHLTAKLAYSGEETAIDLQQQSPLDPKYETTFDVDHVAGVVGDVHVRSSWKRNHRKLTGETVTIRGEKHTLEGTIDGKWGTFELTEKDSTGAPSGRWAGVFLTSGDVLARWTSLDGATTKPITLHSATTNWDYPPTLALQGGGTIAPAEAYWAAPFYSGSAVVPTFSGLASSTAESALNAWSKKQMAAPSDFPDSTAVVSAWDEQTYAIDTQRPGWVALRVSTYTYWLGGTHGFSGTNCSVVDLATGSVVHLVSELPAAGRAALAALVRRASGQTIKVDEKRAMCVIEEKGALYLDVVFDEDDGFYVMAPIVHIRAADLRPLFPAGSLGARVFQ